MTTSGTQNVVIPSSTSNSNADVIIGAAVGGGIACLLLVLLAAFLIMRARNKAVGDAAPSPALDESSRDTMASEMQAATMPRSEYGAFPQSTSISNYDDVDAVRANEST